MTVFFHLTNFIQEYYSPPAVLTCVEKNLFHAVKLFFSLVRFTWHFSVKAPGGMDAAADVANAPSRLLAVMTNWWISLAGMKAKLPQFESSTRIHKVMSCLTVRLIRLNAHASRRRFVPVFTVVK
jgi:hypothetical protein